MRGSILAVAAAPSSLVAEMATGELGDQRLNERRDRLMTLLEQHPDTAFPEACADDAEVEALYRFLRNRRVSPGHAARSSSPTQSKCRVTISVLAKPCVATVTARLRQRGACPRLLFVCARGSWRSGIGAATNNRRTALASHRARRAERATRALSVAMPVFAYICR